MLALLLVGAALYVRPAIFGTPADSVAVGGVPIPGSDLASYGKLTSLTGDNPRDISDIWPPTPDDARAEPLGVPAPRTSSSTDFAFMTTIPALRGRPVTWDPCRPIHLIINNGQAPPGADQLVREAAATVSAATGLQFVFDGPTTETPTVHRPAVAKAQYGNRWSPVLVAWTDPSVIPALDGRVAGHAGPVTAPYYTPEQQHWVSGIVSLDGPQFRELLQRDDGAALARAIVIHEFGHLVGLGHVPVSDQIMYEKNIGQRELGPGDLEGLRQLGLGPCFTN